MRLQYHKERARGGGVEGGAGSQGEGCGCGWKGAGAEPGSVQGEGQTHGEHQPQGLFSICTGACDQRLKLHKHIVFRRL